MFERILAIVFPVYGVIAIGYVYGRSKRPDMRFANQLNMDIFVPALVFAALASKSFDIAEHLELLIGAGFGMSQHEAMQRLQRPGVDHSVRI